MISATPGAVTVSRAASADELLEAARQSIKVGLALSNAGVCREVMDRRLKFYGWGEENTGLEDADRERLFRFLANRLGVETSLAAPPQIADITLREPGVRPPITIAHLFSADPYERLLHTYGKSYPETVRAFSRDFANAPDLVAFPSAEVSEGLIGNHVSLQSQIEGELYCSDNEGRWRCVLLEILDGCSIDHLILPFDCHRNRCRDLDGDEES